mmetsp:Transcript_11630/g.47033  ORF Transcript_11630/g.47033 Transcript_11630/m.47033 type:complete len:341 (+) Transcript_11630:203-1225(+)
MTISSIKPAVFGGARNLSRRGTQRHTQFLNGARRPHFILQTVLRPLRRRIPSAGLFDVLDRVRLAVGFERVAVVGEVRDEVVVEELLRLDVVRQDRVIDVEDVHLLGRDLALPEALGVFLPRRLGGRVDQLEEGVGVVAHDAEDRDARRQADVHAVQALLVGEERNVRVLHALARLFFHRGRHADLAPPRPLHRRRGQAVRLAVAAEHVEERVGARIVGLADVAHDRDGREHPAELEVVAVGEGGVEIQRGPRLGFVDVVVLVGRLVDEHAVAQDARRVDEPDEVRGADVLLDEVDDRVALRHVADRLLDADRRVLAEGLDLGPRLEVRVARDLRRPRQE